MPKIYDAGEHQQFYADRSHRGQWVSSEDEEQEDGQEYQCSPDNIYKFTPDNV